MKFLLSAILMLFIPLHCAFASVFDITLITARSLESQDRGKTFAGIQTQDDRPVRRAVELALFESKTTFANLKITPNLTVIDLDPTKPLSDQLHQIDPNSLVIVDTPQPLFELVATHLANMNRATVNVRHTDPKLRDEFCLPTLYHTIPSDRMYFDALTQYLVYRNWRKVLIIHGPTLADITRAGLLEKSLRKFGATVEDIRQYTLSHHPDDRDKNKPEFLTGGSSYDVVAVIDGRRDFGRYIQYSTRRARPVVGDVGLMPRGWHRTLERYGAPQLNERYQAFKSANQLSAFEAMSDSDFAAWSAIKLITNSLSLSDMRSEILDVTAILDHPAAQVDLYKGTRGSIRTWNHQLRQPILLATSDAVIGVAPMPKFLHPRHYVDTLGLDQPESPCNLD